MQDEKILPQQKTNWGFYLLLVLLFLGIGLPILMIILNFGSSETAVNKEDMEEQVLKGDPWNLPY